MKLKTSLFVVFLAVGSFMGVPVQGQSADSAWKNMDYLKYTNTWLHSGQVLGLHALPVAKLSVVEAYTGKSQGGFVNFYESDNRFLIGAKVESFRKFNSRVAFKGKVAFETVKGKNMGGSVFLDPYMNPLDIVEYAGNTAGEKKLEQYELMGGVTTQLGQKWKLGGEINYKAANYAKFKDLRHTNKLLQLDAQIATSYTLNPYLEFGVDYRYRRRIESVEFKIFGNTDQQYLSLINFGAFYGLVELYGEKGYTGETNPMFDTRHEVTGSVNLTRGRFQWLNTFTYGLRNGYFGEKGTGNIVLTEHQGTQWAYRGTAILQSGSNRHVLDLNFQHAVVDNMQNIYRIETPPGGNSAVVYYGQAKVLDESVDQQSITYTGQFGTYGLAPKWIVKLRGEAYARSVQASIYPFFRQQQISSYSKSASLARNWPLGPGLLNLSYEISFGLGNGTKKVDGFYATPSSSQTAPGSQEAYLNREYEYLTAKRLRNTLGGRYTHSVRKDQQAYLQISYGYTKAMQLTYLQDHHSNMQVAIGYSF